MENCWHGSEGGAEGEVVAEDVGWNCVFDFR